MNNENRYVRNGKVYIAVPGEGCGECDLLGDTAGCTSKPCSSRDRKDYTSVIWKLSKSDPKEPRFHKYQGKTYEVHCGCDRRDEFMRAATSDHADYFNDGSIWDGQCPDCNHYFFWLEEDVEETLPSPKPFPPKMDSIRDLLPDVYGRKEWEKTFCRLEYERYDRDCEQFYEGVDLLHKVVKGLTGKEA